MGVLLLKIGACSRAGRSSAPLEERSSEGGNRDPISVGKKSRTADILMEEEGDNFLKMEAWSACLKTLDESLIPEEVLAAPLSGLVAVL
ncbi:hypothetical protein GQ55_7G213900 [Panicum hallii var. hallii]|uniref:Uncharacterized protein n=1 Tax=Panicum hallii var. hallii TaxID=1504633 RepID=A0A2T7CXH6_9POAL|nr:hypothetical protein GQ55_7G213900 [Panicum hallii var. hallii]